MSERSLLKKEIVVAPIERVIPYERNPKKHPQEQVEKIAAQIINSGWDQPIVVEPDMTIIKGHGRYLAAKHLKLAEVPIIVLDVTKAQAKAVRIADNKVAESDWDDELLREELSELAKIEDLDLLLTGFSADELSATLGEFAPRYESDDPLPNAEFSGAIVNRSEYLIITFENPEDHRAMTALLSIKGRTISCHDLVKAARNGTLATLEVQGPPAAP